MLNQNCSESSNTDLHSNNEACLYESLESMLLDRAPGLLDLVPNYNNANIRKKVIYTQILQNTKGISQDTARIVAKEETKLIAEVVEMVMTCIPKISANINCINKLTKFTSNLRDFKPVPARKTTKKVLKKITLKELNQRQFTSFCKTLNNLKANGMLSPEVQISVDETYLPKSGALRFGEKKVIYKGQKSTGQLGVCFETIFDSTHGIPIYTVSYEHKKRGVTKNDSPEWVKQLKFIEEIYRNLGTKIVYVTADRGYYVSHVFGVFSEGNYFEGTPRMETPTKMFSGTYPKTAMSTQDYVNIEMTEIGLWFQGKLEDSPLYQDLKVFYKPDRHSKIKIPVAICTMVRRNNKYNWVDDTTYVQDVQKIQNKIDVLTNNLVLLYDKYYRIKKTKKQKKRAFIRWNAKRTNNKRYKYETNEMYQIWVKGQTTQKRIKLETRKMRHLQTELRFFTMSILPEEVKHLEENNLFWLKIMKSRFLQSINSYSQRWGVENLFKELKTHIFHKSKTGSEIVLLQNWLVSQELFKSFTIERWSLIYNKHRKRAHNWKHVDSKHKSQRKELSKSDFSCLTFDKFILSLAADALFLLIKGVFEGF